MKKKIDSLFSQLDFEQCELLTPEKQESRLTEIGTSLKQNFMILLQTRKRINSLLEHFCQPRMLRGISHISSLEIVARRHYQLSEMLPYLQDKDGFYQFSF